MNARKARNRAQDALVQERKTGDDSWTCCNLTFDSAPPMYKHIATDHDELLQERILLLQTTPEASAIKQAEISDIEFTSRRAGKYESDPISLSCECDPSEGTVILFYAYLPVKDPLSLAKSHKSWSQELDLCGKVRLAKEGINATVAGSTASISTYIDNLTSLPEFESLNLSRSNPTTEEELRILRYNFFKPTSGCRHVFGESMSIKVVEEICPLGVPEMSVYHDTENKHGKLSPRDFHQKLKEHAGDEDAIVLDVRNYYESSIGKFPGAVTPQIRKFSSFRDYVDRNKELLSGKTILSYCTGGIRCEKATSYLRHSLGTNGDTNPTTVLMLDGGIHNYLEWIKHEGSKEDSLWLGKNYVFDARQSMGLEDATSTKRVTEDENNLISHCQKCDELCARYVKCDGFGCHRLIIACATCSPQVSGDESGMFCCDECHEMGDKVREYVLSGQTSAPGKIRVKRGICKCERERRDALGLGDVTCKLVD